MPVAIDHPALAGLCRRFSVIRLELFGSGASDRFDPALSDLDFLVEFAPMSPSAYAAAYFGLREALVAAYRRPIDLVTGAALTNPYFVRRIEAEKRLLYPPP